MFANSILRGASRLRVKLGIPRSLFYYRFYYLWETFFSELGVEVIVSDTTNKRILDDGVKACVDEACLPIKLFHGHVINLIDRVDCIFVPRFTSISMREYICPEFGGLPDMIRHTLKGLPLLIDTEVNMRSSKDGAMKAAIEAAAIFRNGMRAAKAAFEVALEKHHNFRCRTLCGTPPFYQDMGMVLQGARSVSSSESSSPRCGRSGPGSVSSSPSTEEDAKTVTLSAVSPAARMKIAVIGHSYTIYDRYISMDLLGKLKKLDAEITTIEMVDEWDINRQASLLFKPMFWNYGRNAYGAALHLAAHGEIDGMICITSFGCGIDSFVYDLIERKVRSEYKLPLITITLDEHSGEAGFNTRLEAFVDMLYWRKLHENNISASG